MHRFGQSNIGGFVSLQGRRNIMPILKTPVQVSRDGDESEFSDRVFTKYQLECTYEKLNDMTYAITLRSFIDLSLYPHMKEIGSILSNMAINKRSHLRTYQPCLLEIELAECLADFGGRFTYLGECTRNLPIFADFSVERVEFVNSLKLQCHTQLGAYGYLCKILSTIREFDSLLLDCGKEIENFMLDGFIKFSKDDKAIMSENMLELNYSRFCIKRTEECFKETENAMPRSGRHHHYPDECIDIANLFFYCIFGYKKAIEWLKKLI